MATSLNGTLPTPYPAQNPLTLRFTDRHPEQAYYCHHLAESIGLIRGVYVLIFTIHILFSVVDYLVLAQDAVALWIVRGTCLMPFAAFGYWFSYRPTYGRYHEVYVSMMFLAHGLTMSLSGLISQTALVYMMPATGQVCFGVFFLVGLRFQFSFPLAWLLLTLNLTLAYHLSGTPSDTVVDTMRLLGGLMLLMSVAAYRSEQHTRRAYRDRLVLDQLKAAQEATERRRLQWLEQMTTFLRHELKTAVNGLRTSVELIERRTDPEVSGRYIERCRQSLHSVHTLLDAATQAGSMEAAITQSHTHKLDLDGLLRMRVDEYRELYPDQSFRLEPAVECAFRP